MKLDDAYRDATFMEQGACRGLDPDLFFPGRGESTKEAKFVCNGCPVKVTCLAFSLVTSEKYGIWGGASERERRKMRAQLKAGVVPVELASLFDVDDQEEVA